MQLIIFDLEWNMGYKPYTFDYHGAEQTLRGELIQIGAVKVDEAGRMLDSLQLNLRPRLFRKLHHHIAKVTGLTQAQLDAGVPIKEGLRRFADWCGPDAAFGEWGMDDVPVLKQNLFLNGLDESWPARWYDLQQVFLQSHPRQEGEGMTLESVVDRMGIEKDIPFHNALDDALYTVRIAQMLPLAEALRTYPSEDMQLRQALLTDPSSTYYDVSTFPGRLNHDDYKTDPELCAVNCPLCGSALNVGEIWLKRGNTGYYTQADCPRHGSWFLRFKLSRRDGLHWSFARCIEATRPETLEKYNRQKARQEARLKKRSEAEAAGEKVSED